MKGVREHVVNHRNINMADKAYNFSHYFIRKYGSTSYIRIATYGNFPYFDPMGKLKFQFSLSIST